MNHLLLEVDTRALDAIIYNNKWIHKGGYFGMGPSSNLMSHVLAHNPWIKTVHMWQFIGEHLHFNRSLSMQEHESSIFSHLHMHHTHSPFQLPTTQWWTSNTSNFRFYHFKFPFVACNPHHEIQKKIATQSKPTRWIGWQHANSTRRRTCGVWIVEVDLPAHIMASTMPRCLYSVILRVAFNRQFFFSSRTRVMYSILFIFVFNYAYKLKRQR